MIDKNKQKQDEPNKVDDYCSDNNNDGENKEVTIEEKLKEAEKNY